MKKYQYLLISSLVILTACGNSEDESVTEEGTPIRLEASMQGAVTRADQEVQLIQFDRDEVINVFINEIVPINEKQTRTYNQPTKFITSNATGGLKPQGQSYPYYPLGDHNVKIYAIYPDKVKYTDETFTVQEHQEDNDYYKVSDLMYASVPSQEKTEELVHLTFTHLLSKINVQLKPGNGIEIGDLMNSTITLKNIYRTGKFNPVEGTVNAESGQSNKGDVYMTRNGMNKASAIIFPQDVPSQTFMEIRMGKDVLNYRLPTNMPFESNKLYTFEVTINKDNLSVAYNVEDWEPVTQPGGTIKIVNQ